MAREDLLQRQLSALAACHPGAELRETADGTYVVQVPLELPAGWSCEQTEVAFVVPHAYPSAQPDCFFADEGLRLAGGAMPANSGFQPLDGQSRLWFSWHLQQPWNPSSHTLLTYIRFITKRFNRAC